MDSQRTFEEALMRYRGMLFALGRRYSRWNVEADDLVQDAILVLWKNHERMMAVPDGPRRAAWVWRTAHNAIVNSATRRLDTVPLDTPEDDEPAECNTELVRELYDRIALLAEPDRTIVTLALQGYSHAEVAARVGLSTKNVGVRMVRIKEKLRKAMTE